MGRVEGIMLRKTFPFLSGDGPNAAIAACWVAKAIFVAYGTLKWEDRGRVTATDQDDCWFCRIHGPRSGMKDYTWLDEMTVRRITFRPGVYNAPVGKQAGVPKPLP